MFWKEYVRWHVLTGLLSGYERWQPMCRLAGQEEAAALTEQEYEDYLYGTDADLYVPLWASVCVGGDGALLNAVTLEVIRFYKRFGYRTADLQGNPPDYIGQQCRFLEYLAARILQGEKDLEEAYDDFIGRFVEPTVHEMVRAVRGQSASAVKNPAMGQDASAEEDPAVCGAADPVPAGIHWLLDLLCGAAARRDWEIREPAWREFASFSWERGPEEELQPARETWQASFYDCGRKCKCRAVVQEGCVLSVGPDTAYAKRRFVGCIRGQQYRQTFLTPHRLRYPMVRRGKRGEGKFRRVSWQEAAERIAAAIRKSEEQYGPESRYVMPASGVCGAIRGDCFMKELLSLTGGFLDYYNYYSAACAAHALPYVYGTDFCGSPEEELAQTKLLVLWGNNPADTIWGDRFLGELGRLRERGGRIIVIDPRRSDTALQYADQWIGIRPSTDGALADAAAYEIWSRGLQDQAFMDRFCVGFDEAHMPEGVPGEESYRAYLFGERDGVVKDALWGEKITGVPAEVIRSFAVEFAAAKPACLLPGLGPQRTMNGEQTCRGLAMLACLTGNVGVPGGGSGGFLQRKGEAVPEFVYRKNPYPGKIPSFLWGKAADDWESFSEEDGLRQAGCLRSGIKLLFNLASGLLINQHSDINRTIQILSRKDRVETIVVSDLVMTPGARYADILLPGVSFFETENLVLPWLPADYFLYNQAAVPPLFEGRFEYGWIRETAELLGVGEDFSRGRTAGEWLEYLYKQVRKESPDLPDYEAFRREGAYVYENAPRESAFRRQIREGVPFDTPSGKIEIFSKRLYESGLLPGIPCYTPCEEGAQDPLRERYPLQLIGYHTKKRCHSSNDHNRRMDAAERQGLWIHPSDAQMRGLSDGDLAEVYNARGRMRVPVRVTERIVPGAVALSEGAWYTPDREGRDLRGSLNVLTTSRPTPLAKANPQHTNLVEVTRV